LGFVVKNDGIELIQTCKVTIDFSESLLSAHTGLTLDFSSDIWGSICLSQVEPLAALLKLWHVSTDPQFSDLHTINHFLKRTSYPITLLTGVQGRGVLSELKIC
jgi:hypothetical protein